jgi:hypothetical protein
MTIRQIFDRLGTGQRWWAAELVLRLAGVALLAGAGLAVWWLYASVNQPPLHEARILELLAAAAGVLGASFGSTLAVCGPSLFERVPIPRGIAALTLWTGKSR